LIHINLVEMLMGAIFLVLSTLDMTAFSSCNKGQPPDINHN
jgi:hypothetical protein